MTISNDIVTAYAGERRKRPRARAREFRLPQAPFEARCIAGAIICAIVVWLIAGLYLVVTPKVYVSRWTLIVPGAGQSTTVSLESIGQSTTSVNSPYSSVSLSPRTVYKELAYSDAVRSSAANSLGITYAEMGRPRIKLIDETSLMMFEISGPTAELAQQKAEGLITAFNDQLDVLRRDELAKRSDAVTNNLKSYKAQVDAARQRITEIQVSSGLVSINQFNEQVATLAAMRRRIADLSGDLDRLREEQTSLVARLGIAPAYASAALRLASDPGLAKVVAEYSEASGLHTSQSRRLGPANPALVVLANRRDAAMAKLQSAVGELGIDDKEGLAQLLVATVSQRAELLHQLVKSEAQLSGKTEELQTLSVERKRIEDEVAKLSTAAARLEDLRKEQILAEAVYSSALARVDSSKSDIYGAYPIVQVVAPPNLPEWYEQPRRLYAFGGGIAGTLFSALAWGLVWLHSFQSMKRRKKRLSSG